MPDLKDENGKGKVICPSCDLAVLFLVTRRGFQYRCPRCGKILKPASEPSWLHGATIAFSAILLLICSLPLPFLSISSAGLSSTFSLLSLCLFYSESPILTVLFVTTAILMPLSLLIIICIVGFGEVKPSKYIAIFYAYCHAGAFVDVFVLAVAVSLIKLTSLAQVIFLPGFFLYLCFAWMMIWCWKEYRPQLMWKLVKKEAEIDINLDLDGRSQGIRICRRCFYAFKSDKGEDFCPRCGQLTTYRKRQWRQKSLATLLAAAILFLPSNLYPVMFTTYLGNTDGSNIVEGALFLWNSGSWFVASVIIIASLFIPCFKILALTYLSFKIKQGRVVNPLVLSRLFHIVEFIGKWSMLDVFVVVIMSTAVKFGGMMSIAPGIAILTFCLVVLVTLYAAASFDERLIWDNCVERK